MAAPTAPTLASIVDEALRKAGHIGAEGRAKNEWMEEIKNDISLRGRRLKSLYTTSVLMTSNGVSRYSNPSDYYSDMTLSLMHGTRIGTATGGSSSSVTLASTETAQTTDILGKEVLIYAGTGKNSLSQISAYNTSTYVASVVPNFNTAPESGSSYMIVETYYPLDQAPAWDSNKMEHPTEYGIPNTFYPLGDADYGEFILYPVPYNSTAPFGMKMNYYANLMTLDLTSTLLATLYQRWRKVWITGLYYKALQDKMSDKAYFAMRDYEKALQELMMREIYGTNISELQIKVSE